MERISDPIDIDGYRYYFYRKQWKDANGGTRYKVNRIRYKIRKPKNRSFKIPPLPDPSDEYPKDYAKL